MNSNIRMTQVVKAITENGLDAFENDQLAKLLSILHPRELDKLLMDSLIIRFASSSALAISLSATRFRYRIPSTKATINATRTNRPTITYHSIDVGIVSKHTSILFEFCGVFHCSDC